MTVALVALAALSSAGVGPIALGLLIAVCAAVVGAFLSLGDTSGIGYSIAMVFIVLCILAGIVYALYGVYLLFFS